MSLFLAASLGMFAAATATPAQQRPEPRPVLIVLTSHARKGDSGQSTGYYLGEVTHPLAVFDAAGIDVEFASIRGGEPPVDGLDLDDPVNARYWNDARFRTAVRDTPALDRVDPSRYAAVFFAGGHGAMWDFPTSAAVQSVARAVYEGGGVVGAVCHGPAALVNVRLTDGRYLVAGKRVSAFTDAEERAVKLEGVVPFLLSSTLTERGALLETGAEWTSKIAVDGRLVTGQNPQSATATAEAVRDQVLAARTPGHPSPSAGANAR